MIKSKNIIIFLQLLSINLFVILKMYCYPCSKSVNKQTDGHTCKESALRKNHTKHIPITKQNN